MTWLTGNDVHYIYLSCFQNQSFIAESKIDKNALNSEKHTILFASLQKMFLCQMDQDQTDSLPVNTTLHHLWDYSIEMQKHVLNGHSNQKDSDKDVWI